VKIRKLDIIGFKSFMERTRLRFDNGITGIVGPNGCGKSNVVDAIRWVMGEQSARMLRGKAMEDIIFAGSENKAPMGMAEVQIVFENDGRNVPPEYAHFSEITVGRKLFRNGDSEYSINRTPCRLLDVQELFMGTGVGTRAYSIIGQGRIGLLVSQKPAERRGLIEEAAGISKYKARRKVAERKMEQTRHNLLRVNDVVAEIRRSMGSLQRQARKAARFHKLRDQLKEIELHTASHRCLELQSVQRFLDGKRNKFGQRETELQSQVSNLDASVEQSRVQLLDDDRHLSEIQEALLSTDNQVKLNEQNIEFLGREVNTIGSQGEASAQEISSLKAQLEKLGDELRLAEEEQAGQTEIAGNAAYRLSEREEVRALQADKVTKLEVGIESDRQKQLDTSEQSAEHRGRHANLDQRLLDLQGRLGQAEAERKVLKQRLQELRGKKTEQTERLSGLRQTHLNLVQKKEFEENSLAEMRALASTTEAQTQALREEIGNKRSRLEGLQEIERNYEGCLNGVRSIMQHAESQTNKEDRAVVGLVADILRAQPRYETAVQSVLGDRLQSVVVNSQDAGLQSVDYLKRESEGRSSFIPIDLRDLHSEQVSADVQGPGVIGPMHELVDFDDEYSSVVRYLLGDVVVVEDLQAALSIWSANGHRATLVTLDGEVLEPQGVLTGGSLEGAGTHLLENKREIRELNDRLQTLEAEYRLATDRHGTLKARISTVAASIDSLRDNSHDEEIRIVDQQKDLNYLHDQLGQLDERVEELGYECERGKNDIEQANLEKQRCADELNRLRAMQADIEANIRSARGMTEDEKRKLAGLESEVTELKIQAAATHERQESSRRNLEHLSNTRADLIGRIEKIKANISDGNLRSIEGREKIDASRNEISELLALRERQQAELGVRREAYEKLLAVVQEEEQKLKEFRQELEAVTGELNNASMKAQEVDLELKHLTEDVLRRHKTELFECIAAYHLLPPPDDQAVQRAEKIRNDLERMGDVNPNAVKEYEQHKERFDFLTTQSQDLEDSLQKLDKVIQKINKTSRKRFKEAFEAINQKFQEVFPRLFNGGQARLSLEAGVDVLEAGVEISAQPPGKKLQIIELLSGGEKALTAVAMLFSIFLIKPTPFCLLDEVDAPLDEVNIDRFNTMVKEMSSTSQFILITHNKRTMELLDRLYGVTMEEPGISNIVSVKLTTDEPEAEAMQKAG